METLADVKNLDDKYGPATVENFGTMAVSMFHVGYLDLEPWQLRAARGEFIAIASEVLGSGNNGNDVRRNRSGTPRRREWRRRTR